MAYSSLAQFRANVPRVTIAAFPDLSVTDKIDQADDIITSDLSKIIDFTLVTDTPAGCPTYINLLSQYKTAEMGLVSVFGAKRMVEEQSDRQYWERMYNDLTEKIMNGDIDIADVAGGVPNFLNDVKEDVSPALGSGEYSGFIDEDELEAQRDKYGND